MASKRQILKRANEESTSRLASFLPPVELESKSDAEGSGEIPLKVEVLTAFDLTKESREALWAIFEENMKDFYVNSSFGWDPPTKQLELFHKASRFLILYSTKEQHDESSLSSLTESKKSQILSYAMFRFEREEDDNVLYCYELQVTAAARRKGYGKYLMRSLESIAKGVQMQYIMLTVFKENINAFRFYKSIGFAQDPSNAEPSNINPEESRDYYILMKVLLE